MRPAGIPLGITTEAIRMLATPIVVLDFETTGLAPEEGDRITEVALLRVEYGRITDRFASLVNCRVRVPRHITAYTGITQAMVDAAPPAEEVMPKIKAFIGESAVVSHNAMLDQRFFQGECRRLRLWSGIEPFICTMRIARRVYPQLRTHALAELARVLRLPATGAAHRAANDAELTAHLLLRLAHELNGIYTDALVTPHLLRRVQDMPITDMPRQLEMLCA
jgi:DNA polymerase-3 subunit epsilon